MKRLNKPELSYSRALTSYGSAVTCYSSSLSPSLFSLSLSLSLSLSGNEVFRVYTFPMHHSGSFSSLSRNHPEPVTGET